MTAVTEQDGQHLLLSMVKDPMRPQARDLLVRLLDLTGQQARSDEVARHAAGLTVFIAEYEGCAPRLRMTLEAAQRACEAQLRADVDWPPCWAWAEDGDGWVMRRTDPLSGACGPVLGGRVTLGSVET